MTTITPEREAERRGQIAGRLREFLSKHAPQTAIRATAERYSVDEIMTLFLPLISTERDGRERAEARCRALEQDNRTWAVQCAKAENARDDLQALVAEKNEALRPFAEVVAEAGQLSLDAFHVWPDDSAHWAARDHGWGKQITVEMMRRARTAYNATEAKTGEPGCPLCATPDPEFVVEFCRQRRCPYKPQPRLVADACKWPGCHRPTIFPNQNKCEALPKDPHHDR